ncbi:DUF1761 domain-containing protein [Tsuneonella suprasediminis]|uniref:DUF1761 domain-containing protein n=1 Tax=Tsuneonella suprasediminis TaxID=2306996 RepID=A0A419R586_9SPHN|nr:DUF1761 domain-containing protein [Tsuneonella suprasediminis]RJX70876.1 DUF1761 domain-containing protein [Tsuneonella suprasediminis]
MGPVNWFAVIIAAVTAGAVSAVWWGPLFGRARTRDIKPGKVLPTKGPLPKMVLTGVLLLITSAMMGHMFARVGEATLAAKPWLWFMMSGGLAIAFVIPALWISYTHARVTTRIALIDAGYWLAAYLTMGLVFFLLS